MIGMTFEEMEDNERSAGRDAAKRVESELAGRRRECHCEHVTHFPAECPDELLEWGSHGYIGLVDAIGYEIDGFGFVCWKCAAYHLRDYVRDRLTAGQGRELGDYHAVGRIPVA